jgi:hypothetical protein
VPEPIDKAPSLVSGYARQLLLDLQHAGQPRAETALASEGGWTVLVTAFPSPAAEGVEGLTECDRDCLRLLAGLRIRGDRARQFFDFSRPVRAANSVLYTIPLRAPNQKYTLTGLPSGRKYSVSIAALDAIGDLGMPSLLTFSL